jgi:hypothetical protein
VSALNSSSSLHQNIENFKNNIESDFKGANSRLQSPEISHALYARPLSQVFSTEFSKQTINLNKSKPVFKETYNSSSTSLNETTSDINISPKNNLQETETHLTEDTYNRQLISQLPYKNLSTFTESDQQTIKLKANFNENLPAKAKEKKIKKQKRGFYSFTNLDSEKSLTGDVFLCAINTKLAKEMNLPRQTQIQGEISNVDPKSKKVNIKLKQFLFPDGSQAAIDGELEANLKNNELSKFKAFRQQAIKHGTNFTVSSLVGALDSVEYGSLGLAIATHGISVGVGAGIGLLHALYTTFTETKPEFNLASNQVNYFELIDDITVKADNLPTWEEFELKSAENYGFGLKIKDTANFYSQNYGNCVLFDLEIDNQSKQRLHLSDIILSENDSIEYLYSNPLLYNFENIDQVSYIEPHKKQRCKLAFSLGKVKKLTKYELRVLDPIAGRELFYFPVSMEN